MSTMEYSITVTNKFSLALDEDEDPLEVLKVREQEKEAKKKEKLSEKENKSKQLDAQKTTQAGNKTQKTRVIKDAQQPIAKVQDNKKDQADKKPTQQRQAGGDRTVKFSGESREERNNRRNREDGDNRNPRNQGEFRRGPNENRENRDNREVREIREPREPKEPREYRNPEQRGEFQDRRGRGGLRGMNRGARGGTRGRGFDNRGKREFDRQSGSDKTESLNQDNQDWTNEKTDADVTPTSVESKDAETTDTSAEEKPVEEEARELTLDDWKSLRGNRVKPQFNVRKAGEGEDLSRWKKMYPLERKKEENEVEDEGEYDANAYPQRAGRQKRVDIEINFADNRRGTGGRGRGGRGRGDRTNGRGFGGRGGPRDMDSRGPPQTVQGEQRSPRGRQNAPKVDDEHDFPSLG